MSGIFKGDSIYKSGGSGGGYKDGGALVDGDFINVKNNTVSTYTNISRTDVYYYIELKEGEIPSSIIEMHTDVNATIHVYVFIDGYYYPLGNIGGNTVNSGDDCNININGNSFEIEDVSGLTNIPEWFDLDGVKYPIVKIAGLLWTAADVNITPVSGYPFHVITNQTSAQYPGYFYSNAMDNVTNITKYINNFASGWRIPTYNDWNLLFTDVSYSYEPLVSLGFSNFPNANNSTGFRAIPGGRMGSGNVYLRGFLCTYISDYRTNNLACHADITNSGASQTPNSQDSYLRLCKSI